MKITTAEIATKKDKALLPIGGGGEGETQNAGNGNAYNFALANEEDFEISSTTSSSNNANSDPNSPENDEDEEKSGCCCECNFLLCPFVFFSIFAFFALLACLAGVAFYVFSVTLVNQSYLVYEAGEQHREYGTYMPEHLIQAYQYNSWLFDLVQFGVSFYAAFVALALYLSVFVVALFVTCRISMSPGWKYRRQKSNNYDLLRVDHSRHSNRSRSGRTVVVNGNGTVKSNKSASKKSKSGGKNNKRKNNEEHANESDGGFSNY